ncbi:MAG: MFS transporter [Anaerolineales bacterium]|nr:MFS transporter [Anaerolineales bacterium]
MKSVAKIFPPAATSDDHDLRQQEENRMTAHTASHPLSQLSEQEYKRRIRAWTLYDWANSAFSTTIMAAVLPVYYSTVAGANLASEARATQYWAIGLSISVFIIAIISPILGTVSDIMRGKKKFLAIFVGMGVVGTGLLVLVNTGDWMLASIFFVLGRIGNGAANVFYDALLPHVAKEEDQDRVSTQGYALGYLGGGLLLAINIAMIQFIPGTLGARLSFLSVAVWWAVFSIPIFRQVPEPPSASKALAPGESLVRVSFARLRNTLRDIRGYRELFKYLVAFLIYNDGIGTIIGIATIYGAELGFGTIELILALLLVQFVGIPFSLIFGNLPSQGDRRQPMFLAFVVFNIVMLPLVGIGGRFLLPKEITGNPSPPFVATETAVGQGAHDAATTGTRSGSWSPTPVSGALRGQTCAWYAFWCDPAQFDATYLTSTDPDARYDFPFNGQRVELTHSIGPDHGIWTVLLDGEPALDPDGNPVPTIDAYNDTVRYDVTQTFQAADEGEHVLSLVNTSESNPASSGSLLSLSAVEVLPPLRTRSLGAILGLLLALQGVGALFAFLLGPRLFTRLAALLDTKRSILLSVATYALIAVWGFALNSVVEYWFLAWMVAVVQGGSQALSRSLYAALSPPSMSGEFFGLFSIMSKFASFVSPIFFIVAVAIFDSSRPGILSVVIFFIVGFYLLTRVDVAEGKRVAQEKEAALQAAAGD